MKATSSGILVISTRLAAMVPPVPPTSRPSATQPRPVKLPPESSTINAAVVTAAMAMPAMPNMLPRIEVVGWLRPLSAWMKKTLAMRYSSVTTFMLIWPPPSPRSFSLSS